jgi:8-oxo-dGTP pyrophosphatase MutT (NUDIX family)
MISTNRPDNFIPKFEVVWCLFYYNNEILLLRRQDHKLQPDKYWIPAWKKDEWEELKNALSREIKEETWVDVDSDSLSFIQSYYVTDSNHSFVFHMFWKNFNSKPDIKINPEEHKSYLWATLKETLNLELVEDFKELLINHYEI